MDPLDDFLDAYGDSMAAPIPVAVKYLREIQQESFAEIALSLFEAFETDREFDVIEMGFVLEHVVDPELILRRFAMRCRCTVVWGMPRDCCGEGREIEIAAMRPERDTRLGAIGLMLKPFSTAQLERLDLFPAVWQALGSVSRNLPEIDNAFAVELEPAGKA